jgi:asparagine synthase (glutamine-hydrolysing)
MCGIGGYCGLFDHKLLNDFIDILHHRGPDDCGMWKDDNIGLMHTRLSIIDLSKAGHQPMVSDGFVITFNGEIYNYRELRQKLFQKGETFVSESDTEVLLKMYKHYGESLVEQLNGIFTFAIWDINNQNLFVARDNFGVKPLYYAFTAKGFLFASEMKALLHSEATNQIIDPIAIINYITYLYSPGETTMLTGVKKLEPGNAMIIRNGGLIRKWRFYDIPYKSSKKKSIFTKKDTIKEVRCLVEQAVARQMVADVPIGTFLSGGLDSSAVVAYAKKIQPESKLQCFTIDLQCKNNPQDGFVDDLPYAKRVAKFLSIDLNVVTVGPDIVKYLEKMIYYLDEPQGDPAPLNVLLISQLAKEHGIKVLLSGAGGDDIFSGYRRHYAIEQERFWQWLPRAVRFKLQYFSRKLSQRNTFTRRLSKVFKYAGLDKSERLVSYFYWLEPEWLEKILSREIVETLPITNLAQPLLSTLGNLGNKVSVLDRMLYLEGKHFLPDHNLNYTDKMGMANGVEIRVPLLDKDLVAFVSGLPDYYKQHGREGKWIFKKAIEGMLPKEVIYRSKTGFGAPLRYWLKNELKEMVDDVLSVGSLKKRGIFHPEGVRELVTQNQQGTIDAAYPIFAILCIELWCRLFTSNAR